MPGLDTESAAWDAGESTAIGADPDRPARPRGRGRTRGRARPSPAEPEEDTRTPEEQEAAAKEICLRLLTDSARTKHELGARLRQRGVADEIAERVLERFDEVGLIDDEAFAGAWVRSRHRHRGLGRRAIAQELRRKGVAKEIADEALTEVDDESEAARARELVDRKLRTLTLGDAVDRRKAAQRLVGMLARKGYPSGIAYGVVRTALAEHGAEDEELGPPDLD
ncbi:regulatory protein RecX [Pseudonocardia ailaonensis]